MSLSVRQFLQESNLGDPSHGLRALFPGPVISLRSFVVRLILQTNVVNPPHDSSSPTWANQVCQNGKFGDEFGPPWEWTPVLTPTDEKSQLDDSVGISGWAVTPSDSQKDLWFTHPFGFDWEFYIAPDRQYEKLLAPSNLLTAGSKLDPDYSNAISLANSAIGGLNLGVPGVLGVETDQGLVPGGYSATHGDRVVVFGRWIVDCGHTDYHTEIHPPLLIAVARPISGTATNVAVPIATADATFVSVISRPFLVSQEFGDGAFRHHMDKEITKVVFFLSQQIEAHAKLLSPPFAGTQHMSFFVRPSTPRQSPDDKLNLSGHFTVRSGVTVEVTTTPFPDEVQVLITMNEADYQPAQLPHKQTYSIPILDLGLGAATEWGLGEVIGIVNPITGIAADAQGVAYDLYDAPQPQSVHDSENAVTNVVVDQNMGTITPTSIGDDQPFPIYGSLTLRWG